MGSRTTLVPSISEKVCVLLCLLHNNLKPILFCNLAPSFLYLPTLLPGAQIYLPITASLTITSTTLTPNVTGRTTGEARYLRVVVSQILAV
jgi:hypothetical protein